MTLDKQKFTPLIVIICSDSGNGWVSGDWANKKGGHAGKVFANLEVMIALPVCLHFASDCFDLSSVRLSVPNYSLFKLDFVSEDVGPLSNGIELVSNTDASHLNLLCNLEADEHKLQTSLSVVVPTTGYVLSDRRDKVFADFLRTIIAILNGLEIVLADHSEGKARNDFGDDCVGDLVIINNDGVGVTVRCWTHEFNTNIRQVVSGLEVVAII